jgi:hypothetical protein
MGRGCDGLGSKTIHRDGLELQAAVAAGVVVPGVNIEPFGFTNKYPMMSQ